MRCAADRSRQHAESVRVSAGYAGAALMCGLGTLNMIIAVTVPFAAWAWFISVGAMGAKIVAFLLQYVSFRTIVRRKLRGAAAGGTTIVQRKYRAMEFHGPLNS
jgi:hypothetical protein